LNFEGGISTFIHPSDMSQPCLSEQECKLCTSIRRASLLHFISFTKRRLRIDAITKQLPELNPSLRYFGKHSLVEWSREMSAHNLTCARAVRMGLCPLNKDPKLEYESLDLFLLQMHADKVADVLESWIAFAERVVPLIQSHSDAASWRLSQKLLIHRYHWFMLSKRVIDVVKTIRFLADHETHSRWPGQDRLRSAARQAARAYGYFASLNEPCRSPLRKHRGAAESPAPRSGPYLHSTKSQVRGSTWRQEHPQYFL
jgi:hypothetical protein